MCAYFCSTFPIKCRPYRILGIKPCLCGVFYSVLKELFFLFSFCFYPSLFLFDGKTFFFLFFLEALFRRKRVSPNFFGEGTVGGVPIANRGKLRLEPHYHSEKSPKLLLEISMRRRTSTVGPLSCFLKNCFFIGNSFSISKNEKRVNDGDFFSEMLYPPDVLFVEFLQKVSSPENFSYK